MLHRNYYYDPGDVDDDSDGDDDDDSDGDDDGDSDGVGMVLVEERPNGDKEYMMLEVFNFYRNSLPRC